MDVLILLMVLSVVGIAAAALGGIFAIYASNQDEARVINSKTQNARN